MNPDGNQTVGDRQNHRSDKQTNHPERKQSTNNTRKNQDHWQIGTHTDQHRAQHVIHRADHTAPDQQHRSPCRISAPVEVDNGGNQHQ